ncbi:MAG: hypothetical protein HC769_37710 [Cyanobacteria bacterium CRU_2_1]|nr:hypothetical protein [Cyanobacteria bacterium CRU_2_1]
MSPEQYLWEMAVQNLEYCRHHENQRQAVTNFAITLAGALLTVVSLDQKITRLDLLPALLVMLVGLHGMITSWKHSERFHFHYCRFRQSRDMLDKKLGVSIKSLNQIADQEHDSQFPRFNKISSHRFWFLSHITIILIGTSLCIISLIV